MVALPTKPKNREAKTKKREPRMRAYPLQNTTGWAFTEGISRFLVFGSVFLVCKDIGASLVYIFVYILCILWILCVYLVVIKVESKNSDLIIFFTLIGIEIRCYEQNERIEVGKKIDSIENVYPLLMEIGIHYFLFYSKLIFF